MKKYLMIAAGTLAMMAGTAQAQTTVYSGYDANTSTSLAAPSNPNSSAASARFQSVLSGTSTESFESFATGTRPATLTFTGSAGSLSATLTGAGSVGSATRSSPTGSGQFATDGSKYYQVDSSNFSITFGTAVAAFGFFATDIESDVQLIFTHATGPSETFAFSTLFPTAGYSVPSTPSGSVNFLGFTNTANPFTSVTFGQGPNSGGDILAFDQMTIGDAAQVTPVPEAATWAMMIVGMGAVGATARRRKSVRTAAIA